MYLTKVFVAVLFMLLCCGCGPKSENVVGLYTPESGSGNASVELKPDGSFERQINGRPVGGGKWSLVKHSYFDTGILLDAGSDASEYRLTRRHGSPCWEVRRTFEYWCRAPK
jgi:hypothetical protein